jgi:hypothetical protein
MNERIRELDKAAQEYAGRLVGNDEDSNYNEWFYVYKAKFAELIIRECVELNRQELSFSAFARMLDKYEDHFGIKE